MIKKILVFFVALLIAFPSYASAHGQITHATPAADSKVLEAPIEVSIEFDGKLQTLGDAEVNSIAVTDAQGQIISNPTSVVEGSKISNRLQLTDITGLVSVHYRIVSEDGHPVEGDYSFTVGEDPMLTSVQGGELSEEETGVSEESGSNFLVTTVGVTILGVVVFAILRRIKK